MSRLGSESVERLRPNGQAGRHGARAAETATRISSVALVPRFASEESGNTNTTITGYTLYCPPATDLKATDRVRARGQVWEIDGDPAAFITRKGKKKAVVAELVKVTG